MQKYFRLSLKGSTIFLWWLLYIVGIAITAALLRNNSVTPEMMLMDGAVGRMLLMQGLGMLIIMLFGLLFTFFLVRATVRSLSLEEEPFTEDYDIGRFLGLAVKGILLTAITLGIYFPWFAASLMRYFAAGTSFRDTPLSFAGKGMTLFGILVLVVVLPYGLMILLLLPMMVAAATFEYGTFMLWLAIFLAAAVLIQSAYTYLLLRWSVDLSWNGRRILFRAPAGGGIGFIFGQMLLAVVTLGLYAPAMYIRIWRYTVSHIVSGERTVESRLGMAPEIWKDYFYILGQFLLTIITAGIYGAWAVAGVMRRLVSRTYVQESEPLPMPEE